MPDYDVTNSEPDVGLFPCLGDNDEEGLCEAVIVDVLNELARNAFANSAAHGFWDDGPGIHQALTKIALIHSEASEALEVIRDAPDEGAYAYLQNTWYREADGKPEGLGSELADIIIRALDMAAAYNVGIGEVLVEKMAFNSGRPHKHGKAL